MHIVFSNLPGWIDPQAAAKAARLPILGDVRLVKMIRTAVHGEFLHLLGEKEKGSG
jgi:hypothetical protein